MAEAGSFGQLRLLTLGTLATSAALAMSFHKADGFRCLVALDPSENPRGHLDSDGAGRLLSSFDGRSRISLKKS